MRIIILGSGPAHPVPRSGCHCPACRDARRQGSKSRRNRSSALIQLGNKNILIDASPDFPEQIKKNSIINIDAVLITHGHSDAVGGIKQLARWLKNKIVPIYLEKITWRKINRNLISLEPHFIRPNIKSKILNHKLFPFRVTHDFRKEFPSLGFKIGDDLIYASDFKIIPPGSRKYFKNIKTAILDGAMYFDRKIFSHENIAEAIELADNYKIKNLYLTQIGHSYPSHQIAVKRIAAYRKKYKIKTKVYLAYDGLIINPR